MNISTLQLLDLIFYLNVAVIIGIAICGIIYIYKQKKNDKQHS